jgi:hypothetical protein
MALLSNILTPSGLVTLAGTPSSGVLTNCTFPTLNQNTTGTAANVTGTVAILNGGTGQTTRQAAMDALAGATTTGQYLRGNGTDVVMANILASDVPVLNQNTTGTAANVTGTVAIANGGTGITSFGTGVATFLGTPSSANMAAMLTDETGAGANVFATGPSLSGVILNDGYTEEVFAVTGTTPALSPTNGSIQTWTLTAASTPTAGTWAAGQSMTLMVNDTASVFTVAWTSVPVVWVGGTAPTLIPGAGFTVIQLWKVGTTVYGALTGQVA